MDNKMLRFLLVGLFCIANSEKLPDYIKPCRYSDPNLNQCILEHGNEALPNIVKGDKKYKILQLAPLQLPSIHFTGGNIDMRFDNVSVNGLENLKLINASWDTKSKRVEIIAHVEKSVVSGDYSINGRILMFPLVGNGKAIFDFYGTNMAYSFEYDIVRKNDVEFLKLKNENVHFNNENVKYHFENLFNGNERLTEQMNNFLNENWRDLYEEMKPTFEKSTVDILGSILGYLTNILSLDEMFIK